jgi:AcrR family transcriptional regulator
MSARQRREREKVETRRKILDAARELFALDGYDAVTMRAIADRIEYTPTAIYFHFRDKGELIERLCSGWAHRPSSRLRWRRPSSNTRLSGC